MVVHMCSCMMLVNVRCPPTSVCVFFFSGNFTRCDFATTYTNATSMTIKPPSYAVRYAVRGAQPYIMRRSAVASLDF